MGDEPYTTQRATSQQTSLPGSGSSTNQRLSYATKRAELLFGCYRRGDANDPDRYVSAIAAVLTLYDFEIMRDVTDPRTGIQTTEKFASFMPNAGELKIYCDAVDARQHRLQELGKLPRADFSRARLAAPPPAPGDQATIFVPDTNPRYPGLVEWSKTADKRLFKFVPSNDGRPGIWVSWGTWESRSLSRKPAGEPMTSMKLSDAARRTMAELDAERNRQLPIDMPQEFVD